MNIFLAGVATLAVIYIGYEFARINALGKISSELERDTHPFDRIEGKIAMLVVGDSTAAGVGAETPQDSVPGRLSALLDASVENHAVSGAVVSEIAQQLGKAKQPRYDVILIQAGANDVVHFKSLDAAAHTMDALLGKARIMSERVILLTAGRIGQAPLLPRVTGALFNRRTRMLRARFMPMAEKHGVRYVDLYGGASDQFDTDPRRYYAADMFHPSGEGYGIWFQEVSRVIDENWKEIEHGVH